MAKGQMRSNKEKKKPKQAKTPAAIPAGSRMNPARPYTPAPEKK